ncbi:MAG TPA: glycosyltransferase family 4 protein [Terriglobales bacterium]|nr:glycosyltransferase family 4 protein [Terriglobales bacterium]
MRILFCNKYDYPFSGTESYLFDLIRRLDAGGHQTSLFSMDHRAPNGFRGRSYRIPYVNFKDPDASFFTKVRLAAHAIYSRSARRAMRDCIADFAPEVAHTRGIYHHLSPSILWELKRRGVPVLYHLNDFKILCPSYNLVDRGEPCRACSGGAFYHVVTRRCYAGSRASAMVLAAESYFNKWLRTYERCVDLFLAPSEFVRGQLVDHGLSAGRIEVLPHFQELPGPAPQTKDEGYVLYFGRLSREKGIDDLLHALAGAPHIPVVIAGDGPDSARLQVLARELKLSRVTFAGHVNGENLKNLIARCRFSVFPSHAYETLGKSILESYAYARPVIATDLGSRRESVEPGVTGLLYPPGNRARLAEAMQYLYDRPELIERMGTAGRSRVRDRHAPEQHLQKMVELYTSLASRKILLFPQRATPDPLLESGPAAAPRPVRVAFIGGRGVISKYSGVESYYEQAGAELARLGHEVTVYCRDYFTPQVTVHNGMRVRRLPTIRSKHLETVVHTLLSSMHAMMSGCDVVHYHCLGPALFSFLPRLAGKKTVVTVQGLDWQRAKWGRVAARVLRWGEAAAVRLPDATMVVSRTLQRYYREQQGRGTFYVPNGAAGMLRRPARHIVEWGLEPDKYVLFLGRFSPEKNCHLLIEAFERIDTDTKLVFAGGSSHSSDYVEKLRSHESPRIRFLPWVAGAALEELLSHAAIFVLPSDIEGLSLALLDAMGAGVCALTSDIPENREVVEGAGFMFRRGDVRDLERVLRKLIEHPELRRESATRGRARVRGEYHWPEIARAIEAVYLHVLGWPAPADAQEHRQGLQTISAHGSD